MSSYREIVTKTIIGKGKKSTTNSFKIVPEQNPDTILGCWVINHNFKGENDGSKVIVNGSFDINVWYSYSGDTKTAVTSKKFTYNDVMNIALKPDADLGGSTEIIVRSLKQPTVMDVSIIDEEVKMNVEKELGVEIVGDGKVKILVEDDEDEYDIIEEVESEIKEEDLALIDENVEEEYLK